MTDSASQNFNHIDIQQACQMIDGQGGL